MSKKTITMREGAKGFALAKTKAKDTGSYIIEAITWTNKVFGTDADVKVPQQTEFAHMILEAEGIEDKTMANGKSSWTAPTSRLRKIIRHRAALPAMFKAIRADARFDGSFTWGEGLKVATILNKEPNMSAKKCVNAYFNKKSGAKAKTLNGELQAIANKLSRLKGVRKGTPNGKLVDVILKAFAAAEYDVE